MKFVLVTKPHTSEYPDPISFLKGEDYPQCEHGGLNEKYGGWED